MKTIKFDERNLYIIALMAASGAYAFTFFINPTAAIFAGLSIAIIARCVEKLTGGK